MWCLFSVVDFFCSVCWAAGRKVRRSQLRGPILRMTLIAVIKRTYDLLAANPSRFSSMDVLEIASTGFGCSTWMGRCGEARAEGRVNSEQNGACSPIRHAPKHLTSFERLEQHQGVMTCLVMQQHTYSEGHEVSSFGVCVTVHIARAGRWASRELCFSNLSALGFPPLGQK